MKWFTHQSLAFASATVFAMPKPFIAGIVAGAILPDMIDQAVSRLTKNPQKTFKAIHRGTSHWYGWYAGLTLVIFGYMELFASRKFLAMYEEHIFLILGLSLGALYHIALDMLTPSGVPLWPMDTKKRCALPICSTGSTGEYIFLALALGVHALFGFNASPQLWRMVQRIF